MAAREAMASAPRSAQTGRRRPIAKQPKLAPGQSTAENSRSSIPRRPIGNEAQALLCDIADDKIHRDASIENQPSGGQ